MGEYMACNTVPLNTLGVFERRESFEFNSSAGKSGEEREIKLNYIIIGSADPTSSFYFETDDDARAYFRTWFRANFGAPVYFNGLPLKSWDFRATSNELVWEGSLTFGVTDSSEDDSQQKNQSPQAALSGITVGLADIAWSFGNTTQNFKNAVRTVGGWSRYTREVPNVGEDGGPDPGTHTEYVFRDFGGKIKVNVDGEAEGVDLVVPTCSFTITARLIPSLPFNPLSVISAVGAVNSDTWGCFGPREVLFCGCDIRRVAESASAGDSSEKLWVTEVVFNFQYQPTTTYPAPDSQQITKAGFDVLWAYQTPVYDSDTKTTQLQTMQVNVEQVYKSLNFATYFPWTWDV